MTGPADGRIPIRAALAAPVMALAVMVVSGCGGGPTLEDVPTPALVDGPTYPMDLRFESALNLPLDAPVKVDGATVGVVDSISAQNYTARVGIRVSEAVELHQGLKAELRLTSPMGTAFVELDDGTGTVLRPGTTLALQATRRAPDVSDLLSSLSVVVRGGSYQDIGIIIDELNTALGGGNSGRVRSLLGRLDETLRSFNARTDELDRLLAGMDRLFTRLAADTPRLMRAVQRVRPAIRTLTTQQDQLVRLLAEVRRFGRTGGRVLRASREDLVSVLEDLQPVLRTLVRTRKHLRPLLEGFSAFARNSNRSAPGDFNNFDLYLRIDQDPLLDSGDQRRPGRENDGGPPLSDLTSPSGHSDLPGPSDLSGQLSQGSGR